MRSIDADALMPKLKFILEAENQIYRRESWGFAAKCIHAVEDAPTIEPDWDAIWDALSKVYNMKDVPDEAKSIIGDVMLDLDKPEIIRCQDCKYASPNGVYGCRLERFSAHDEGTRMFAYDYCSKAERRADEQAD